MVNGMENYNISFNTEQITLIDTLYGQLHVLHYQL